jgi:hypothetical protein
VLIRLLREQGVWVVYQPPEEKRAGGQTAGEVALSLTAAGAYDRMEQAVRQFRERFPSSWVAIE